MAYRQHSLHYYLESIVAAAARISSYIHGMDAMDFYQNKQARDAVLWNCGGIKGACRRIQTHFPSFAANNRDMPFGDIYRRLDAAIKLYHDADLNMVWEIVHAELPVLSAQIATVRAHYEQSNDTLSLWRFNDASMADG
ncbi:HepT-like ribonuclease domain-containing protein [Methylobacillus pratensis]|nr:HepT-like ribonuclease domain-containing protein [Methylobacillus flagellatus]